MGWFSNNFPSVARLFGGGNKSRSRARQNSEKGRRRAKAVEPETGESAPSIQSGPPVGVAEGQAPSGEQPQPSEATRNQAAAEVESQPSPASPAAVSTAPSSPAQSSVQTGSGEVGDDAPGNTPALISTDTGIAQMYDTWVELEGTILAAQAELQTLLANRENAEAMRSEAQVAMEQADAAWQEAGLLGEAAWRAFERGFSVDSPDFVNRLRVIREVDEARKTQAQLHRASNKDAWKEADRARQNATADILKALTALDAAAAQVSRELRETNYLPASANSLRNAALDDLRCAHAIGEELALLGQEALSHLGASRLAEQARIAEELANEASVRQAEIQRPVGDATPLQEFRDLVASQPTPASISQDTPPVADKPEVQAVAAEPPPEPPPERSPVPSPQELMSAAEQMTKEFEASTSAPPESTGQTVIQGPIGGVIEAGPAPEGPSGAPLSAAEELQREMASMRPTLADSEPVTASALEPSGQVEADELSTAPSDDTPSLDSDNTPSLPLPESYSGRVYLMFPGTLDQNQVGSVWEALDELAGSGAIIDSRLVSREEGVQFTLELKTKVLDLEALKKKMPGATLTALQEDRLKVDWPIQR